MYIPGRCAVAGTGSVKHKNKYLIKLTEYVLVENNYFCLI